MYDKKGRSESEWVDYCDSLRGTGSVLANLYSAREQEGLVGEVVSGKGVDIPILYSNGGSLAEAWENSVIALAAKGTLVRTEYDADSKSGNYTSPPSIDATMFMTINRPSSEPMIHYGGLPGGLEDLEEYRLELVAGIKDDWIRDPEEMDDTRWEYTYHERMADYGYPGLNGGVDQLSRMVDDLSRSPITRRSQVVSWKPWQDPDVSDPPCFQSLWGRIIGDESSESRGLNLNMRFRSRDAYKAAFMNDFAFISLGEDIAREISEKSGNGVSLSRFMDQSDSYHIYGSNMKDFFERFVPLVESRLFDDYTCSRESVQPVFDSVRPLILEKVNRQSENLL